MKTDIKPNRNIPKFPSVSCAAWQLVRNLVGTVSCFSSMDAEVWGECFNMITLGSLHFVRETFREVLKLVPMSPFQVQAGINYGGAKRAFVRESSPGH